MAEPDNKNEEGLLNKLGDLLNKPLWGTDHSQHDQAQAQPHIDAAPAPAPAQSNQPFAGPAAPAPSQPSASSHSTDSTRNTPGSFNQPAANSFPDANTLANSANTANEERVRELEKRLQEVEGQVHQQQAAAPAPSTRTYTVKSGDSLSKIAQHFYGDMMQWHRIYDANRDQISNPDLIHPGQELKIP